MTNSAMLPPVTDQEWLARFVLFRGWVRADKSMRPDAFIPHPYPDLSVSRHTGISEAELWQLGNDVAQLRSLPIYGRADILAGDVTNQTLQLVPTATPKNHVNITGWPADKPQQKIVALELVAKARYVAKTP